MKARGDVPHILLAGDCSDAAYIFRPVKDIVDPEALRVGCAVRLFPL